VHFFGGVDMPELYKHIPPERHWKTVLVNCESLTREILPASSKAAGRTIDQAFVIVDLKGFSLHQFWQVKSLARSSFQVSQDYFPETMGQLAIVNAPVSFTFIWSIIKPWLSKETVAKVDILGSDYQEVLLDWIDKENLPASLGGDCECEGGCEYSFAGPWKEGLEERRDRRRKEAIQQTNHELAGNGVAVLPIETLREDDKVPGPTITESPKVLVVNEQIGNGEPSSPLPTVDLP